MCKLPKPDMKLFVILSMVLMGQQQLGEGAKVLFLSPICTKSQKNFFSAVSHTLADNGHEVTMVSPFKPLKPRPNVREIVLDTDIVSKLFPNVFASSIIGPAKLMSLSYQYCADALGEPKMQALLKEEFDIILMSISFADCLFSVTYQLNVPFILVHPAANLMPVFEMVGNPHFPSVVGSPFLNFGHPQSFLQRIASTFVNTMFALHYRYRIMPNMETECRLRGLCPEDMPNLVELKAKASLVLTNGVREIESPVRPSVPAVIYCGGIHCHESRPLPQDLEEWVAGAGDAGFIFISLGSAVKPSSMPEEYRKVLVEVFGSLKQRVLWKWDLETMDDLPPNVRLGKWLPQQDILGDPRLQLFITHGGMLSIQESMYNGIPILGLPVFGDQMFNMYEAQRQGWGRVLSFDDLTPQILNDTIKSVMTNERMRKEAQRRSKLMRDQLVSPSEVINFWVEYVIRHEGAPHLRSPVLDMSWYQLYNVDAWLTILCVVATLIYIILRLLVAICSYTLFSKSKTKKD